MRKLLAQYGWVSEHVDIALNQCQHGQRLLQCVAPTKKGSLLLSIPRSKYLGMDSSPHLLKEQRTHLAQHWQIALGARLVEEAEKSEKSPWYAYISLLPARYDGLPLLYILPPATAGPAVFAVGPTCCLSQSNSAAREQAAWRAVLAIQSGLGHRKYEHACVFTARKQCRGRA